jgi:hypothetical protein
VNVDKRIAREIGAAIRQGRLTATDGVPNSCHVTLRHQVACPVRRTLGKSRKCTCGDRLAITLHAAEHGDCAACRDRPSEH